MNKSVDFITIFPKDSNALIMGIKLRKIIKGYFENIEESIVGGNKVKLALYSRDNSNNILCGIQAGKDDSCMLYVHHVQTISHDRLKFSGKGKHAKRIKFLDINEILEKDINWLLSEVNKNAPF